MGGGVLPKMDKGRLRQKGETFFRLEEEGCIPYNGPWEAPPKNVTFFRLKIKKRVGILQAEV